MSAKARILELLARELASAKDNLYRANHAVRGGANPAKKWGRSDQTLGEILAGYEHTVAELEAAKRWVDEVPA